MFIIHFASSTHVPVLQLVFPSNPPWLQLFASSALAPRELQTLRQQTEQRKLTAMMKAAQLPTWE